MTQSVPRRMMNRVLQLIARFGPGASSLRPFIHCLRGVKMNGRVWIGEDVCLENNYPDRIEIGDQAQIVMQTTIISHFKGPGKVIIRPCRRGSCKTDCQNHHTYDTGNKLRSI
jgi:hypothetical protein